MYDRGVSIPVTDLSAALADRPWGYLVTVGPDLRAHVVAVSVRLEDGSLWLTAGRTTRANAAERPEVTIVFPPVEPGGMSLVVDASAAVHDERVELVPGGAVLHRAAPPA